MSSVPDKTRRTGQSGRDGLIWFAIAVFVLSGALYAGTLGHNFVFDDVTLILQDPTVSQLRWSEILTGSSYRPIRTLTYALNYALGGQDPFGYHLLNVLLHAANSVLVLLLIYRLAGSRWAAVFGSLLFALHPAQTAAVAYISGRKDLLAAFFILLGFLLYLSYRRSSNSFNLAGAFFCFVLAILSKEVAIVFPALLLLIDAYFQESQAEEEGERLSLFQALLQAVRKYLPRYLTFLLLAVAALYWALATEATRMVGYWGGTLVTNLGTSFKLFAHYLKLTLWPHPLIADYTGAVFPVSTGLLEPWTLISIALALMFLVMAWVLFRPAPLVSVGLLWFLLGLLPVLHIIPFHEIAADHFLYVPMIGVALAGGVGFRIFLTPVNRFWLTAAAGVLFVTFSWLTLDRNQDWQDGKALWEATLREAPGSYRASSNLGFIYFRQGLESEGIDLTRKSLELQPENPLPWGNLGAMMYEQAQRARAEGRASQAQDLLSEVIRYLDKSIELDPHDPFSRSNLGNAYKELALIYDQEGQPEEALHARIKAAEIYKEALSLGDQRREVQAIWLNFGGLLIDAGRCQEAPYYLKNFLETYPNNPRGNYWMGYCYFEDGDYEKAIPYLERSAEYGPTVDTWDRLATSYQRIGEDQKAIQTYRQALNQAPSLRVRVEIHYNLGILYSREGREEEAAEHLNEALRLQPGGPLAGRIERALRRLSPMG